MCVCVCVRVVGISGNSRRNIRERISNKMYYFFCRIVLTVYLNLDSILLFIFILYNPWTPAGKDDKHERTYSIKVGNCIFILFLSDEPSVKRSKNL